MQALGLEYPLIHILGVAVEDKCKQDSRFEWHWLPVVRPVTDPLRRITGVSG